MHKPEVTLILIELVVTQCGIVQCCIACHRLHHNNKFTKNSFTCIIPKHSELCLPNAYIHTNTMDLQNLLLT
jgi:hypothetical protein